MSALKIGILGCRGIPNYYGGFEQLAQELSEGLVQLGNNVTVYNSHRHPYRESNWRGVQLIRCFDAEYFLGTAGQFIYDLNCIRNARRQRFDILLFLGYTSSSVWGRFFPRRPVIISNMDGMEWQRSKYSKPVQRFLRYAEKLAVKHSDFLIADAVAIQQYIRQKYNRDSRYIAYGARVYSEANESGLYHYGIRKHEYYMLMARMEPENNIEMVLDGFHQSDSRKKIIVIGKADNHFGKRMKKKYQDDGRIVFAGPQYDQSMLHSLKANACAYFHGHSVGGTNPSLLEAMAGKVLIVAHENAFNREVLGNDGLFFSSASDVKNIITQAVPEEKADAMITANFNKIAAAFNWETVISRYQEFMQDCYTRKQ